MSNIHKFFKVSVLIAFILCFFISIGVFIYQNFYDYDQKNIVLFKKQYDTIYNTYTNSSKLLQIELESGRFSKAANFKKISIDDLTEFKNNFDFLSGLAVLSKNGKVLKSNLLDTEITDKDNDKSFLKTYLTEERLKDTKVSSFITKSGWYSLYPVLSKKGKILGFILANWRNNTKDIQNVLITDTSFSNIVGGGSTFSEADKRVLKASLSKGISLSKSTLFYLSIKGKAYLFISYTVLFPDVVLIFFTPQYPFYNFPSFIVSLSFLILSILYGIFGVFKKAAISRSEHSLVADTVHSTILNSSVEVSKVDDFVDYPIIAPAISDNAEVKNKDVSNNEIISNNVDAISVEENANSSTDSMVAPIEADTKFSQDNMVASIHEDTNSSKEEDITPPVAVPAPSPKASYVAPQAQEYREDNKKVITIPFFVTFEITTDDEVDEEDASLVESLPKAILESSEDIIINDSSEPVVPAVVEEPVTVSSPVHNFDEIPPVEKIKIIAIPPKLDTLSDEGIEKKKPLM